MNLKTLTERLSRKHLIWIAVAVGVVFTGILLLGGPKRPAPPVPVNRPVDVNLLGNADLEKEQWRATAEKELETLRAQQQELSLQLQGLAGELKKQEEGKDTKRLLQQGSKDFPPMPPLPAFSLPPSQPSPQSPQSQKAPPLPSTPPAKDPIRVFGPEANSFLPAVKEREKRAVEVADEKPYLPSGSFVPGMLLSGLDAPAGVTSSKEPHPVLIRLSDLAVLPNRFRLDIKECFIVGEGYGDLSSERAYIRTTTLSCVRNEESKHPSPVDIPLKGFVAGEDGKVGLRGRVVSKQGQFLARALMAGFAEGISDVLRLSATTVSVSPLGATQSINPDEALKAGALSGVGRAMERLSQHYIEMAQRVFPVIEIDAGRNVDVVVLQGKPVESPIESKEGEQR